MHNFRKRKKKQKQIEFEKAGGKIEDINSFESRLKIVIETFSKMFKKEFKYDLSFRASKFVNFSQQTNLNHSFIKTEFCQKNMDRPLHIVCVFNV